MKNKTKIIILFLFSILYKIEKIQDLGGYKGKKKLMDLFIISQGLVKCQPNPNQTDFFLDLMKLALVFSKDVLVCLKRGIDRIDSKCVDVWNRMETRNNCAILEEIFDKLETTRDCHSGASWRFLCIYFQNIARTGFPDRFLLKNQHLWVRDFYLPDYLPGVLFIAGASLIVALRRC